MKMSDEEIVVHTIYRGEHLHIFWNNFAHGYRCVGVKILTKYVLAFVVHFGRGEFVIEWRK